MPDITILARRTLSLIQQKDLLKLWSGANAILTELAPMTESLDRHPIARMLAVTISNRTYPRNDVNLWQIEHAVETLAQLS